MYVLETYTIFLANRFLSVKLKYCLMVTCVFQFHPFMFFFSCSYLALYAYKPQKADELELRKGEMYRVIEKCQDGWFKGTSLRNGMSGVFPGNYVTPVSR